MSNYVYLREIFEWLLANWSVALQIKWEPWDNLDEAHVVEAPNEKSNEATRTVERWDPWTLSTLVIRSLLHCIWCIFCSSIDGLAPWL